MRDVSDKNPEEITIVAMEQDQQAVQTSGQILVARLYGVALGKIGSMQEADIQPLRSAGYTENVADAPDGDRVQLIGGSLIAEDRLEKLQGCAPEMIEK